MGGGGRGREKRNGYQLFVKKPQGKRIFRPKSRKNVIFFLHFLGVKRICQQKYRKHRSRRLVVRPYMIVSAQDHGRTCVTLLHLNPLVQQRTYQSKFKADQPFCLLTAHNPYPTAFPYGNGMVLHFYQQQESSTTKTVNKVINKGLKAYV